MNYYTYQCSFCRFKQRVQVSQRHKPQKSIQGFCAKDKFHGRTKFVLVEGEE